MRVQVRFFAALRDAVGAREVERNLEDGSTVATLLEGLTSDYPRLAPHTQAMAPSVNQDSCTLQTELHEGDEVAFSPPVSGGRDV